MMGQGAIYDLLCEQGFVQGGKLGTAVDTMARATALAVSIGVKHGAPLDVIRNALTSVADRV